MTSAAVTPESILRDLQRQWEDLAHDDTGALAKTGGVLRACAMTLVVAAKSLEDALDARQIAGTIMRVHPSRAIVIHPGDGDFSARVFAECWKPFGKAQQICSEGIEIVSGKGGNAEVARFLVPLRVPDLPVVLWCRGIDASKATHYRPLYDLADKIIFDTKNASDADEALRSLRRLHAYGMRVADLHWTRLSGWREALAHLFDGGFRAADIRLVKVTHGGTGMSTCARYFESWMRSSLPLARVSIEPEYGPPGLFSVTLSTPKGDLRLANSDEHTLAVTGPGLDYQAGLPSSAESSLMQEELSILGSDDVYERVLTS